MVKDKVEHWGHLRQFGIEVLTGESCAYSMRLLCDLTQEGKAALEDFFGGCLEFKLGSNWNSGSSDRDNGGKREDHVASVTLSRGLLYELGAFLLLRSGHEVAAIVTDSIDGRGYRKVWGTTMDDWMELKEILNKRDAKYTVYHSAGSGPQRGSRNVHYMSGRAT